MAGRTSEQRNPTGTIAAVSIALIARIRDPLVAKLNCREHLLARLMRIELSSIPGWPGVMNETPNIESAGLAARQSRPKIGEADSTEPQQESDAHSVNSHWFGSQVYLHTFNESQRNLRGRPNLEQQTFFSVRLLMIVLMDR